jgi:hypothetical protein
MCLPEAPLRACWRVAPPGGVGNRDAAAGYGEGPLGQTGRLDLASNRPAPEERRGKSPQTPPRMALRA